MTALFEGVRSPDVTGPLEVFSGAFSRAGQRGRAVYGPRRRPWSG